MRPRYLEIEGLQSFKDLQSIDFDKLSETGLFGIFGPTGSGKSTILDAITLALYGNVQRANRGTQGIMNTAVNTMRVSFSFDLAKANERRSYRVERTYRRKKDSLNSVEARVVRLLEVTAAGDIVMADKQGEVNAAVVELLGLQFDDFTRSVVLPQNKFQEFLLSQKAEKTKMLERIFYLEEYGRQLAEKINKSLAKVKIKLSGIEGAVSVLGNVSEEALKEAEEALKASAEHRQKIDEKLAAAEKEYHKAKEVWELTSEYDDILKKEGELAAKESEINGKRSTYEKAVSAAALEDKIISHKRSVAELENTEAELKKLDARLEALNKEIEITAAEYERASLQRKESIPKLVEYRTKLTKALNTKKEINELETVLQRLRQDYTDAKKQITERELIISGLREQLTKANDELSAQKKLAEELKIDSNYRSMIQKGISLEEELHNSNKNLETQRAKLQTMLNTISEQQKELAELEEKGKRLRGQAEKLQSSIEEHKKQCPGDKSDISREETKYYSIKAVIDNLKPINRELGELQDRLKALDADIDRAEMQISEAERLKEDKFSELTRNKLLLEEKKNEYQRNAAYELAQGLKDNEPCPVCGAVDHPRPAVHRSDSTISETENIIKELQALCDKLDAEGRKYDNQCIKLQEQHRNLQQQAEVLKSDIGKKLEEQRRCIDKLPEEFQTLQAELAEKLLEEEREKSQQRLKAIEAWELQLKKLEEESGKLQEELNNHNVDVSGRLSRLNANKAHFEEENKVFLSAEAENRRICDEYKSYVNSLGVQTVKGELERIQHCDSKLEAIQKSMEAMEEKSADLRKKLETVDTERQQYTSKFSEIDAEGRGLKYQLEEKLKEIKDLLGDKDISKELSETEAEINRLSDYEHKMQQRLNDVRGKFERDSKEKKAMEKQREIYADREKREETELRALLEGKGFSSIEEVENSLVAKDVLSQMQKELQEYDETRKDLEIQKSVVLRKLKGRSITAEEWQLISGKYNDLKQQKENSISIYESSRNKYNTIKSNYESWLSLGKEMQRYTRKLEHLEQLKSLMKGNGFIEYISEERLRYVAKEASETLGILTRYRYGLELDIDNDFVIRDNANGGIQRMVTSLSGGETFLTSLSLALALSSQIQLKGQSPLEFFFLDEGFGTLDNNLLDLVVDSLERLSTEKRVIGLISHVPELKNRIARRLIVEPPSIDGAGSRIFIDKA